MKKRQKGVQGHLHFMQWLDQRKRYLCRVEVPSMDTTTVNGNNLQHKRKRTQKNTDETQMVGALHRKQ